MPLILIPITKKHEYWNHMVARAWEGRTLPPGLTVKKLHLIKQQMFQDNESSRAFWTDVILHHAGLDYTPEQLEAKEPAAYKHCVGNFWSRISLGS